jgi:threonylcarbamoyladenosine tRNA methylthiotransferase MtaB
MLRILSAKKLRAFYEKHLNQEFTVLFEHENKNGIMNGFTENYIKIVYPYDENLVNKSFTITTKAITEDGFVSADLTSILTV